MKTHKATKTRSDTIEVTQAVVSKWLPPPFQRPLRINAKVRELAEMIKTDGGVIPGVITLGVMKGVTYLLDGQHRIQAFLLSEHPTGYADVRVHDFEEMGDMGQEFVNLNSRLVTLRPDDVLRGLESSMPTLKGIRDRCPFVGYDQIRRGTKGPIVSMSTLLRCNGYSSRETPGGAAISAMDLARNLTLAEASMLSDVVVIFEKAWGRDIAYARLWNALNLTMCLWIYRRMVLNQGVVRTGRKGSKSTVMTLDMFRKSMMSLSADTSYLDWLVGRMLTDRDRSPCFSRIKAAITARFKAEGRADKIIFPSPAWYSGAS